nr:hypothetical protein [Tanacetum cinerariifolium]
IVWARSARRPLGRLWKVFCANSDTMSRSTTPLPVASTTRLASGSAAVGARVARYCCQLAAWAERVVSTSTLPCFAFYRHAAHGVALGQVVPAREWVPAAVVAGRVFEGAVLHQLAIQPPISGVVDILEKDAEQIGADGLG